MDPNWVRWFTRKLTDLHALQHDGQDAPPLLIENRINALAREFNNNEQAINEELDAELKVERELNELRVKMREWTRLEGGVPTDQSVKKNVEAMLARNAGSRLKALHELQYFIEVQRIYNANRELDPLFDRALEPEKERSSIRAMVIEEVKRKKMDEKVLLNLVHAAKDMADAKHEEIEEMRLQADAFARGTATVDDAGVDGDGGSMSASVGPVAPPDSQQQQDVVYEEEDKRESTAAQLTNLVISFTNNILVAQGIDPYRRRNVDIEKDRKETRKLFQKRLADGEKYRIVKSLKYAQLYTMMLQWYNLTNAKPHGAVEPSKNDRNESVLEAEVSSLLARMSGNVEDALSEARDLRQQALNEVNGTEKQQAQRILADARPQQVPDPEREGDAWRRVRFYVRARLDVQGRPHNQVEVTKEVDELRKNRVVAKDRDDVNKVLDVAQREWQEAQKAQKKAQETKDAVQRQADATNKSKLKKWVTQYLQGRNPGVTIDQNEVQIEMMDHSRLDNNNLERAAARVRYMARLLVLIKNKHGGRVPAGIDSMVTKEMRKVARSKMSWADALKQLESELKTAAPDGSAPAPRKTVKRNPAASYPGLMNDSDVSEDEEEEEGEEHYEDDSDDDSDDEGDGGGGGGGGGGGDGGGDDEDDNPYKEEEDEAKDRALVDEHPECKDHVDHCADLRPVQTTDGEATGAYGKNVAINQHLVPFQKAGTPLPNDTWYVGTDPYTADRMDAPPVSEDANGLYSFGFLGADDGYDRTDKAEWVEFYQNEMDLVLEQKQYFNLGVSDAWSLGNLKRLWRTTGDAHEGVDESTLERVFAWRLTVVHLRALRAIGCDALLPVTACFEMDALVDNVAHMLKYRRCIYKAKCLYANAGTRSLHEQYRAGILNVQHAHHHQDESATETGIARRMIRQAHVANYVHYYWYKQGAAKLRQKVYDEVTSIERKLMLAERFTTNPPMAPLMCSAPPRSGKSALALLMVSFAYKLGASVEYGVSPNKKIPVADVNGKFAAIKWNAQGMPMVSQPATNAGEREKKEKQELKQIRNRNAQRQISIYSEDVLMDLKQMNVRIHAVADEVEGWTFHVRDEAQSLIKGTGSSLKRMRQELQNSYPIFYGLSMCISATLLPVFKEAEVVGSTDSIYQLFNRGKRINGAKRVFTRRGVLEKNVVLQDWSFPIAPDYLTPPRGAYPLSAVGDATQEWYRDYFQQVPRTTNYYGTHFHVVAWQNKYLTSQHWLMLDKTLYQPMQDCNRSVAGALNRTKLGEEYQLEHAYVEYLKNFNAVNTRYFDVAGVGAWREGPTTRIANAPIKELTRDAARMLEQAQEWLDDPPVDNAQHNDTLHPMLILAPAREQGHRREWAVMLCKMAWLRMHRDYTTGDATAQQAFRDRYADDDGKQAFREEYGINVLVYASDRTSDVYVGLVCQEQDFTPKKDGLVLSIVFDPTLRENRLPEHYFNWDDDGGVMLRSILVPELHPDNCTDYVRVVKETCNPQPDLSQPANSDANSAVRTATSAAAYLRENVVLTTYSFNSTTNYKVEANAPAPPPASPVPDQTFVEVGEEGAEVDQNTVQMQPGTRDDPDEDDEDDDDPEIVNVNAIALRLCVSQHANAQTAIESIFVDCGITKVAAVGHAMFSAGLTLQTTFTESNQHTRMFVPKYMGLWISDRDNGPDLSALYQLVGRGFVDMKRRELPNAWKLNLLGQRSLRYLIKEYGDAELIASMVHNESLEGRRMTLGATLWTADTNGLAERYGEKRLKGDEQSNTLMRVLFRNSPPSRNANYHRVFGKVRDCLAGQYAAKLLKCLTNREKRLEHWDRAFEENTAEIELKRHEVHLGAPLLVGREGNNLDDNDQLCRDADEAPALPQAVGSDASSGPTYDPHDIPPEWYFDPDREATLRARLDRAEQRAKDREQEIDRRVDAFPRRERSTRKPQISDEVDGRNLRMRIAAREFDRDNKWNREALAEEIVCERGRFEGLFDWYLSELRMAEEKRYIKTGNLDRIAPPIKATKPSESTAVSERSVQMYMVAAKKAHKAVLARSDQWVRTFCKYVKEYLLDLEHGPETSRDAQWCQYRCKYLGTAHGYSEAHEQRWSALRLRLAKDVINDADVGLMGRLLDDSRLVRSTHVPNMTWDDFVTALGKVFSPSAVLTKWVALQVQRQKEKVRRLKPATGYTDDDSDDDGDDDNNDDNNASPSDDVDEGELFGSDKDDDAQDDDGVDGDASMGQAQSQEPSQQGDDEQPAQDGDSDSFEYAVDPQQAKADIAKKKAADAAKGKGRKRQGLDPADFPTFTEQVELETRYRKGPRATLTLAELPAETKEEAETWEEYITDARRRDGKEMAVDKDQLDERFQEELSYRDLRTLGAGEWLNDAIINTYMELLQQRSDTYADTNENILRCHFFKTLFFRQFYPEARDLGSRQGAVPNSAFKQGGAVKVGYNFLKVAAQTANVDVFGQEMIFLPVNHEVHWCLIVINFKEKKIEYFDPAGGQGQEELTAVRQWLRHAWKQKQMQTQKDNEPLEAWDEQGWRYVVWPNTLDGVPHQEDAWNCGVFLIMTADYYSQSAKLDYAEDDVNWDILLRHRILHAVLRRTLPGTDALVPPADEDEDGEDDAGVDGDNPSQADSQSSESSESSSSDPNAPKLPDPQPPKSTSIVDYVKGLIKRPVATQPIAPAPEPPASQQTEPPASQADDDDEDDAGVDGDHPSQASDATQPPEHARAEAMADMAEAIALADSYWIHISSLARETDWARVRAQMHELQRDGKYDGDLLLQLKVLNEQTRNGPFKKTLDNQLAVKGKRVSKTKIKGADDPDNDAQQLGKKPRPNPGPQ